MLNLKILYNVLCVGKEKKRKFYNCFKRIRVVCICKFLEYNFKFRDYIYEYYVIENQKREIFFFILFSENIVGEYLSFVVLFFS